MNPVFMPWLVEIGIISARTLQGKRFIISKGKVVATTGPPRPPLPSELLSTFVVFGAYMMIAEGGRERQRIGSLLAWGTVLATVLLMFQSNPSGGPSGGTFSTKVNPLNNPPLPSGPNTPPQGGR